MNPNMTPVDWAKRPILEKYADFSGRASRAEYWWYFLALMVAFIVARIVDSILGLGHMVFYAYGPLAGLLWLATIVPSIAVGVRRLHDTGRTGWWVLLPIVPYCLAIGIGGPAMLAGMAAGGGVGFAAGMALAGLFMLIGFVCAIILLVFMVLPSTPGDNRYGPNPYGEGGGAPVAAE
jgi:uncharacterized membrane protein YhaH (DUF805 family)